jgi:hypothetical protein
VISLTYPYGGSYVDNYHGYGGSNVTPEIGVNLWPNGGFELGNNSGWEYLSGGGGSLTADTTHVRSGSYAGKITLSSSNHMEVASYPNTLPSPNQAYFAVTPGNVYQAVIWYYCPTTVTAGANAIQVFITDNHGTAPINYETLIGGGVWTEIIWTYTATQYGIIAPVFYVYDPTDEPPAIWVDDAFLTCIQGANDSLGGTAVDPYHVYGGSGADEYAPYGGTGTDVYTMQEVDIVLVQNNDEVLNFALTSSGSALNLTSATVNMYLKTSAGISDTDPSTLTLTTTGGSPAIVVTNAAGGLLTVTIPKADLAPTAVYGYYRMDVVLSSQQHTAIWGSVTITKS